MNMAENKSLTDRFVDSLFSKDKTLLYLIILAVLGLVLRIIAAINLGVFADDMHFAPGAINFLASGKLEYWDQSAGLWFAVTDIFYKILGATQLASRFSAVLFGTMLIFAVFLLAKEFFKDNKTALIASLLVAVSPFHIKSMMAEMDVMAMFFSVFSFYFFIKAINKNYEKKLLVLSGILLGLAVYTKVYPLLFIPGMLIFFFYKNYKENKFPVNKALKLAFLFLIVIFVFCLPALTHNYLLYKSKGIVDDKFARFFGIEKSKEIYSWAAGSDKLDLSAFFFGKRGAYNGWPLSLQVLRWVFNADPIIFILGVVGALLLWKRKELLLLLLLLLLPPYIYLGSAVWLIKHFLFMSILMTFPAAFALNLISNKIRFVRLRYIALAIILFSVIYIGYLNEANFSVYEKSAVSKLMDYKQNIDTDSLVVVDSRVYRGQMTWAFSDRHYLEASYLNQLFAMQQNKTGVSTNVYFIECTQDDCGWGTVYNQPEFNASMEDVVSYFKNISMKQATISEKTGEYFTVYKTTLNLAPEALALADSTHNWWLYPLGYNRQISAIFDDYSPKSFFDVLLNNFARFILYFSVFSAFASILILVYYLINST